MVTMKAVPPAGPGLEEMAGVRRMSPRSPRLALAPGGRALVSVIAIVSLTGVSQSGGTQSVFGISVP